MSLLPIDDELNCSFLNSKRLSALQEIVANCKSSLGSQKKKRDILKKVQQFFTFERVFKTRGVQGITGVLKVNKSSEKLVFKIPIDLDKSVDHENIVTKELNKLREFCPHFVGNVGMINLPVSNDFIDNPDDASLFKSSNDYFPCNVLLLEYVSPVSFYHVCKYLNQQRGVVIAQLAMIMMAIDIAQQKCKLTQYDMHADNILVRCCEENALFLYKHKGRNILVPTYGLYPIVIDMGSSYVKAIEGKPMYTSSDNYHNGLQPTLYDNLNDVHHLLISTLFYLEDKAYVYDFLRTRFMFLFKHVPILSHKGWKQLPYNILDLVLKKIREDCPSIDKSFEVYKAYDKEIVEILNGLIILPWMEQGNTSFGDCMVAFLGELEKIQSMKSVESTDDVLYILRETVDCINDFREEYERSGKSPEVVEGFAKDWKRRIGFVISNNLREVPRDLDFGVLLDSALRVAERLSANYYGLVSKHVESISESYLQTPIKCPMDAVDILLQNATPGFKVERTSKLYVWDSVEERKRVLSLEALSDVELERINNLPIKLKGNALMDCISR